MHFPNFLDQRADRREAGRVVKTQAMTSAAATPSSASR